MEEVPEMGPLVLFHKKRRACNGYFDTRGVSACYMSPAAATGSLLAAAGSGKSMTISMLCILEAIQGKKILCCREFQNSISRVCARADL